MRPYRRAVGLISHILLLQWILLGSGLLCARHELMTAHAMDVAHAVTEAAGVTHGFDVAGEGPCQAGRVPTGSCSAMTSCSSVATPPLPLVLVALQALPDESIATFVDEPASRSSQPEPPPPRA